MDDHQPVPSPPATEDGEAPTRRRIGTARAIVLGAVVALLVALAAWWPTVVAQVRAVVVLASVLDVPVLGGTTRALTGEPRVDEDARLAGAPTTVFRPAGDDGPWPAVLFLTGADDGGRQQEDVVRLGQGLARAGFVVVIPDLPGMRDGRIGADTLETGRDVTVAAARLDDVRGDRIALASVSAGASIALLIAASEDVEPHVSVVAGIAPYADAKTIVEVATTGSYRFADGEVVEFRSTDWMQTAIARSLFAATEDSPEVERLEERALDRDRPVDYLQGLSEDSVEGVSSSVVELLRTEDPERFDERYAALPDAVHERLELLSPIHVVGGLDVPIELASAPKDKYFPLRESRAIVKAAPDARLTVTTVFDHAIPDASLGELGALGTFDAFVVRVLREAAADK